MVVQLTAEDLLTSIWTALRRIEDNLSLPPAPLELPAPVVHVPAPDLADLVNAVTALNGTGPSAEDIARALADVLAPQSPGASQGADALGEVARALEKLDFRLKGMGVQAHGGGSVTLQPGQSVEVSNLPDGGATEVTLQAVRDTLYRRTDALPAGINTIGRVDVNAATHTVATAETSVAAGGAFVTVVADTPATDLTLVGYNAEVSGLLEARYRMRLITGTDADPTILHTEAVTTGANAWQPLRLSVPPGTRAAVQVVHDQVTAQLVRATLNWSGS